MEGPSSNATSVLSELVNNIIDTNKSLHQFILESKAENDAQRALLDQLDDKIMDTNRSLHRFMSESKAENDALRARMDQMATDVKEIGTRVESVAEKMVSMSQSSVIASTSTAISEKSVFTFEVTQENINAAQSSRVPKDSMAPKSKMLIKGISIPLDQRQETQMNKEVGAVTAISHPSRAQPTKRPSMDTVSMASKSMRLTLPQIGLNSSPVVVRAPTREAEGSVVNSQKIPEKVNRLLDAVKDLWASLTEQQ